MRGFSFRRVALYARWHYTMQYKSYAWNALCIFAMPVLFALLEPSPWVAVGLVPVIYIVCAFVMPVRNMAIMRNRHMLIIDNSLPVSTAERWTFILLNLAVVYPVVATLLLNASVATSALLCFDYQGGLEPLFSELYINGMMTWEIYVMIQILSSGSLLIATLARRHLGVAYIIVFVVSMCSIALFGKFLDSYDINVEIDFECLEIVLKTIYCLLPVVLYMLSYVALKRRQVKW